MIIGLVLACAGAFGGASIAADRIPAPELFQRLIPADGREAGDRGAITATLAERPHAELVSAATGLVAGPRHAVQRRVALDVLRPAAAAADIELAFRLAVDGAEGGVEDEVASSFVAFVSTLHARDRAATGQIVRCALERGIDVQGLVIEALSEFRHARTGEAFERLMEHSSELRRALVVPLALLWVELPAEPPAAMLRGLRKSLDDADPGVRREAALACGWLQDGDAARTLVTLLNGDDEAVSSAAYWALGRISGLPLRRDARVWRSWLDQSERWWIERAPDLFRTLRDGAPHDVLSALQEIGRQRLHRERIARELEVPLAMDSTEVVVTTAAILMQLRARSSAPALMRVLLASDPVARAAAHSALVALTGQDLPPDYAVWRAWLQSR